MSLYLVDRCTKSGFPAKMWLVDRWQDIVKINYMSVSMSCCNQTKRKLETTQHQHTHIINHTICRLNVAQSSYK